MSLERQDWLLDVVARKERLDGCPLSVPQAAEQIHYLPEPRLACRQGLRVRYGRRPRYRPETLQGSDQRQAIRLVHVGLRSTERSS